MYTECCGFESHPSSSFFFGKKSCLGCRCIVLYYVVLRCFVVPLFITVYTKVHEHAHVHSGTSLFQPHLGPAKVAGLARWLDFRVRLLCETYVRTYIHVGRSIRAKAIGCFSKVAAFQRLGLARFQCIRTCMHNK